MSSTQINQDSWKSLGSFLITQNFGVNSSSLNLTVVLSIVVPINGFKAPFFFFNQQIQSKPYWEPMKPTGSSVLPEWSKSPPSWCKPDFVYPWEEAEVSNRGELNTVTLNSCNAAGTAVTFYSPGWSGHKLPLARVLCSRRSLHLTGWFCHGIYPTSLQSTWKQ